MHAAHPVIDVVIVDDAPDLAALLSAVLSYEADIRVVGTLTDAACLSDTVTRLRPRVVLLDLTMPGKPPLDALREMVVTLGPACETRVLVYSGYDDEATVAQAKAAGAFGFVSKSADPALLAVAVRSAAQPPATPVPPLSPDR